MRILLLVLCITALAPAHAQVEYPYPLQQFSIQHGDSIYKMAYMDIAPENAPAKNTVLLLHGKNFNGYYWKDVIPALVSAGFRVIVPDQVGWGRSSKPVLSYSFHWLASNTQQLLHSLNINKIIVVGHSMGGMLAARFTMMYPSLVEKLVLENPIGLEDYKRFTRYQSTDSVTAKEQSATYESYKKYQQSYYPTWKPEYEQYVKAQAEALQDPQFKTIGRVNALTFQMIYEQPVCYEWDRIAVPTLLIIGQEDRTVVGKDQLTEIQKKQFGQYPRLGQLTKSKIRNAKLVELKGVGHIPHIQEKEKFLQTLLAFIK